MTDPLPETPQDDDFVPSDAELRRLLTQARGAGDEPLRRLLGGYLALRRVTGDVIAYLETRDGVSQVARIPLLARAKRLSTGSRG